MRRLITGLGTAALAAVLALLMSVPAFAVGAGGVEMRVGLERAADDRLVLEVGEEPTETIVTLENLTDEPRTVRLYGVSAVVDGETVSLGDADTAPWLGLDRATVELAPRETRAVAFTTSPSALPEDGEEAHHAAVVMELSQGDTVVMRAASVVRVEGAHALPPLLVTLAFVAAALLVIAVGALSAEQWLRQRPRARPRTTAA